MYLTISKNAILYNVFSLNLREHSLETVNAASGVGKRLVLSVCHKRTALFSNKGNYYRDGDLLPDPITTNLVNYGLTGRVKRQKKCFVRYPDTTRRLFSCPRQSTGISLHTRLVNYPRFQPNRNRKIVHCGGKQQQKFVSALFLS